ncbi:MAG: Crp/Fnr family transcriptional regulator [Cellvibrionaceae bacterium]|nr:Crp/Fnr family transcriptional regulator [Cellvibrionaceae bacterium]
MTHFHRGHDWLEELPDPIQTKLRQQMKLRQLAGGAPLYQPGDSANALYQVKSGLIAIKRCNSEGAEFLATLHGPGECFGEIPLLSNMPRRGFAAIACGATEVACLGKAEFEQIACEHPQIYQQLNQKLCAIINSLLLRLESLGQASLRQRLAGLLVDVAERHGRPCSDGVRLELPISQTDMGNMLGATRQSIQRELRRWREQGWIGKQQGRLLLCNIAALKHEAELGHL